MKRCAMCKKGTLVRVLAPESIKVGSHVFTAKVKALKCRSCGEVFFDGPSLERFELRVAVELARSGESSGEVMRFMRKAGGLRALELSDLLGVTPETVSRWETGKRPMEHRAMAVLSALILDAWDGRTATLEALNALRRPRKLGRKVELSLSA